MKISSELAVFNYSSLLLRVYVDARRFHKSFDGKRGDAAKSNATRTRERSGETRPASRPARA